ncbi:MAG: hypothetical protein ABIO44_11700 [Saprospiraceae bacterium]
MKYLCLIFTLSFSLKANGQDCMRIFLGKDFDLYKGRYLILDNSIKSTVLTKMLYLDLKDYRYNSDYGVAYPSLEDSSMTNKDSLIGKVFKVVSFFTQFGHEYNSVSSQGTLESPFFKLMDTTSGKIIYFKYNKFFDKYFPFMFCGLELKKYVSSTILRRVDPFDDCIKIYSPSSEENFLDKLEIIKIICKNTSRYYLKLSSTGSTLEPRAKGVTLIFNDGTKWLKPQEEIDVELGDIGSIFKYNYSSFITLSQKDLALFKNKSISKYRLYIYDQYLDSSKSNLFTKYVKAIISAN